MQIRPERAGDSETIRRLTDEAFGQPDEGRLVDMLRADGDAAISLVAESEAGIVGHVMFSRMSGSIRALGLAPVSVSPKSQKRGYGASLIREGLALASREKWQAVFVLGDPAYYQRFGFSAETAESVQNKFAGPYFMALELESAVLASPLTVEYATAFDRL